MQTTTQPTQAQHNPAPAASAELALLIDGLADDLRDSVKEIEKSIPSTQNHYGRYMALLGQLSGNNRRTASILAAAMIRAGANSQGVRDAMQFI